MSDTIELLNGDVRSIESTIDEMQSDGFYYGYLGENALSSSACKQLLVSPKAYEQSLKSSSDTAALREGRFAHLAILEPDKFKQLSVVEGTRASKAYKLAAQEQGYYNVCTASEYENARSLASAIWDNFEASMLISNCEYELPTIGEVEGLPFRAKADCIDFDTNTIVDVKTTSDPVASFPYAAKKYRYALQAALYCKLFAVPNFTFLVINKKHKDIAIYECSEEFLSQGELQVKEAADVYKKYFNKTNTRQLIDNDVYRGTL